jgi:hypothetical protein
VNSFLCSLSQAKLNTCGEYLLGICILEEFPFNTFVINVAVSNYGEEVFPIRVLSKGVTALSKSIQLLVDLYHFLLLSWIELNSYS